MLSAATKAAAVLPCGFYLPICSVSSRRSTPNGTQEPSFPVARVPPRPRWKSWKAVASTSWNRPPTSAQQWRVHWKPGRKRRSAKPCSYCTKAPFKFLSGAFACYMAKVKTQQPPLSGRPLVRWVVSTGLFAAGTAPGGNGTCRLRCLFGSGWPWVEFGSFSRNISLILPT